MLRFFFRGSSTRALFRWLTFAQFARQGRRLEPVSASTTPRDAKQWLVRWEQEAEPEVPALMFRAIVLLLAVIMGIGAMLGILAVSMGEAVNIWAPLLVFAFIPLLFFLLTLIGFWFPGKSDLAEHPMLRQLLRLMHLLPYRASAHLLIPWIQWQLQRATSIFLLAAVATFFVFATFQDVRFVWSSTFIEQSAIMHQFFSAMAWPWHWWGAAPSPEAVAQSRFYASEPMASLSPSESLWPFVISSIAFYGLLPRMLLTALYRQRLRGRLKRAILTSANVDVFLNIQQHDRSRSALMALPENEAPTYTEIDPDTHQLIGWRLDGGVWPLRHNLGNGLWQEDEQWLQDPGLNPRQPVVILTGFWQTPLGELADCIATLRSQFSDLSLVLVQPDMSSDRADAQWRSWSYFAGRCGVELTLENSS